MNAIYGILSGYAVLVVAAAVALALVPFVRFVTRRAELMEAIGRKRHAELYPLSQNSFVEVTGTIFCLAFFLEKPLHRLGIPFVSFLSRGALVFWVLSSLYAFGRSIYLFRELPDSDVSARAFARMTAFGSGAAAALGTLVIIAVSGGT